MSKSNLQVNGAPSTSSLRRASLAPFDYAQDLRQGLRSGSTTPSTALPSTLLRKIRASRNHAMPQASTLERSGSPEAHRSTSGHSKVLRTRRPLCTLPISLRPSCRQVLSLPKGVVFVNKRAPFLVSFVLSVASQRSTNIH